MICLPVIWGWTQSKGRKNLFRVVPRGEIKQSSAEYSDVPLYLPFVRRNHYFKCQSLNKVKKKRWWFQGWGTNADWTRLKFNMNYYSERPGSCWGTATNLLGLDGGLAAVSSIVVAEGSVVDRITVVVSHERLRKREWDKNNATVYIAPPWWMIIVKRIKTVKEKKIMSCFLFIFLGPLEVSEWIYWWVLIHKIPWSFNVTFKPL